ncbi:MAG TPA: hypothetical protein VGJ20_21095 [Xanthobacteraceae bacterium]
MARNRFERIEPGRQRIAMIVERLPKVLGERRGLFIGQIKVHFREIVNVAVVGKK